MKKIGLLALFISMLVIGFGLFIPDSRAENLGMVTELVGRSSKGKRIDPEVIRVLMQIKKEVEKIKNDVDLTQEQKNSIQAAIDDVVPQASQLRKNLRAQQEILRNQLLTDPSNTSVINTVAETIASTRSEMTKLRITTMGRIATVLTPEQRSSISTGLVRIDALVDQLKEIVEENHPEIPTGLF
ncbi:MAG: Spy/CpxP family protein refolding chaperone [Blastocatellia bacterium]|nr:Spy/CpxP family protein refolding chaperone [Blastocatellia bacterium]